MVRGGEQIRKPRCPDPDYEEIEPRMLKQETSSPVSNCDLCGSNKATVRCDKCNNQAFCLACDDMYHRHPRRSTHIRKAVEKRSQEGFVRPPLPPKGNETLSPTPPQPPPRKNKKTLFFPSNSPMNNDLQILNSSSGRGRFRGTMGNRPLPPTPGRGGLTKAESTGNLSLFNNRDSHFRNELQGSRVPNLTLPRSIQDINQKQEDKISPSVPQRPPSAQGQFPSMSPRLPPVGAPPQGPQHPNLKGRKFSLQQIPPAFDHNSASLVEPQQGGSPWLVQQPANSPQKVRSQSISDAQWDQVMALQDKRERSTDPCVHNRAGSDIGIPPPSGKSLSGRQGNATRGMVSSVSVSDLNALAHFHPQQYPGNMQSANSFQQMNMMRYDGNMMWMACPLCQPQSSMYPGQTHGGGMKRTTSNLSMNMSSAASDVPHGYHSHWGHHPHMHSHPMPMYPGYYPGYHPQMMHNMSMHGSSMSIPDSMHSPSPSVNSSHRSRKSSKSSSFRSGKTNGHRSRNRSRRRSEESEESIGSFSGSEEEVFSKSTKQNGPWQCDHCTFINPGHSQACGMCSKTLVYASRDKKFQRGKERRKSERDNNAIQNIPDICEGNKLRKSRGSRSIRSESSKSNSNKRRNKSKIRSSSRSISPPLSESDDRRPLEKQLQDLRLTPKKMSGDYEGVSITSRERKRLDMRGQYRREGEMSQRGNSRSHSLRPCTPGRELYDGSPGNCSRSSYSFSDDDPESLEDSISESEEELPPLNKSAQDATDKTLIPTLSSVLKKLEGNHHMDDDSHVDEDLMSKQDSFDAKMEDHLDDPVSKPEDDLDDKIKRKIEELVSQTLKLKHEEKEQDKEPSPPRDANTDVEEPSLANTLDDVDTMGTNEIADIQPSHHSEIKSNKVDNSAKDLHKGMHSLGEIEQNTSIKEGIEQVQSNKDDFFEKIFFENKNAKDIVEEKELDPLDKRVSGGSYEFIDEPNQMTLASVPKDSNISDCVKVEKATERTYESISVEEKDNIAIKQENEEKVENAKITQFLQKPINSVVAASSTTVEKLDSLNKSPSLESFQGKFSTTPDRQCTPLSFSSSDAQFYSPPDTPDSLNVRKRHDSNEIKELGFIHKRQDEENSLESSSETASLDQDEHYRSIPFEDALATQEFPLAKSASDQGISSRIENVQGIKEKTTMNSSNKSGYAEDVDEKFLSVEELITRRKQKAMKEKGLELVQLLRGAEEQGYNPEEVSIALTLCGDATPLEWLQDNWGHMIDTVMTLATNYGQEKKFNDIGEVTSTEAASALRIHKGNIWAAVTECVEERQRNFDEIHRRGNFKRDDILAALKCSDGSGEEAYFQLNKTQQLGSFFKKIWSPAENVIQSATKFYTRKSDEPKTNIKENQMEDMDDDESENPSVGENEIKTFQKEADEAILPKETAEDTNLREISDKKSEKEVQYIRKEDVVVHPLKSYGHFAVIQYADDEQSSEGNDSALVTASKGETKENFEEEKDTQPSKDKKSLTVILHEVKDHSIKKSNIAINQESFDEIASIEKSQEDQNYIKEQTEEIENSYNDDAGDEESEEVTEEEEEPEEEHEEIEEEIKEELEGREIGDKDIETDFKTEEEEGSVNVTTGRLSLSFTQTSAQEANVDVKSQTIQTQQVASPTKQDNSEDASPPATSDNQDKPNKSLIETKELYKESGPVTVQKATLIVGKAIAKAMARETTTKEGSSTKEAHDDEEKHSHDEKSSSSEYDSESDDIARSLDTIPEEESRSRSRSQNEQESSTKSGAGGKSGLSSIPPAVASFSGPIFIPSQIQSSHKQSLKDAESASKSGKFSSPATTFHKSESSLKTSTATSKGSNIFSDKGPILLTPSQIKAAQKKQKEDQLEKKVEEASKLKERPPPEGSSVAEKGAIKKEPNKQTRPDQDISSHVMTKSSLTSMQNRLRLKQTRSAIDSSGESDEEEPMIDDLRTKGKDVELEEVEDLKEQIKLLKQELGLEASTEDGNGRAAAIEYLETPQEEEKGREEEDEVIYQTEKKTEMSDVDIQKKEILEKQTEQDEQLKFDRTVRRVLAEGQVRNYEKAEIVAHLLNLSFDESDSINAAEECSSIYTAVKFLRQECEICAEKYPMARMVSMLHCTHRCCYDCANNYFSFQIKTKNIRELSCPFCGEPDLDSCEEVAAEYLNNLDILLKGIIDEESHELFQRKLRDWTLMKDPNFRWCNKCSSGFIANARQRKLICPDCKNITCAQCRNQWEAQHEGTSCEAFAKWKEENNPETQAQGVARHLAECGITCPKCKFTYSLAKGGCMHFTCTECKYEFCSGCGQPFKQGAKCPVGSYCERLGLHAHHPRNCLFYLRDKEPLQLQHLLKENSITFDSEPPEDWQESSKQHCRVQEQKETLEGLKDAACGRTVLEGHAGLCRVHYIEYLVEKINSNSLDPVSIFDEADLRVCLRRNGKAVPPRRWESEKLYRDKLTQLIKEELPLA